MLYAPHNNNNFTFTKYILDGDDVQFTGDEPFVEHDITFPSPKTSKTNKVK